MSGENHLSVSEEQIIILPLINLSLYYNTRYSEVNENVDEFYTGDVQRNVRRKVSHISSELKVSSLIITVKIPIFWNNYEVSAHVLLQTDKEIQVKSSTNFFLRMEHLLISLLLSYKEQEQHSLFLLKPLGSCTGVHLKIFSMFK